MPVSDIFAKPRGRVMLPPVEEFEASFSLRVKHAQSEEELRQIGAMVRDHLEQGTISQARANELWSGMQERSNVLRSVYDGVDVVRQELLENRPDVLQEAWGGVTTPSHEGKPVERNGIPESCLAHIDLLATMMREHLVQQVQIGSTQFQVNEASDWQFVPHVVAGERNEDRIYGI